MQSQEDNLLGLKHLADTLPKVVPSFDTPTLWSTGTDACPPHSSKRSCPCDENTGSGRLQQHLESDENNNTTQTDVLATFLEANIILSHYHTCLILEMYRASSQFQQDSRVSTMMNRLSTAVSQRAEPSGALFGRLFAKREAREAAALLVKVTERYPLRSFMW
jgi:hypothetical protein